MAIPPEELSSIPTAVGPGRPSETRSESAGASPDSVRAPVNRVEPVDARDQEIPLGEKKPEQAEVAGPEEEDPSRQPSPAEDLRRIESINWLAACRIQLERGNHPDREIDGLLKRVFFLDPQRFLGPYAVRLLVSLALVLVSCSLTWLVIWNIALFLGWSDFVRELSTWMSTMLMFLFGLVVSQPSPLIDEPALEKAGREAIERLRKQTASSQTKESPLPATDTTALGTPAPVQGDPGTADSDSR